MEARGLSLDSAATCYAKTGTSGTCDHGARQSDDVFCGSFSFGSVVSVTYLMPLQFGRRTWRSGG